MHPLVRRFIPLAALGLMMSSLVLVSASSASAEHGTATKISAGGYSACAVTPANRLKCWGDNTYGQLGIGDDLTEKLAPVLVPNLENVTYVSVGDYSTCAILQGGKLKCWGLNSNGQLGDGTTDDRHVPTQVEGLTSGVVGVSVGEYHACARLKSGKVKCWGNNTYGEIGNGTSGNEYPRPKLVNNIENATQISAGLYYSCATVNEKAKCWGYNSSGQLGDGTTDSRHKPTQVYGLDNGVKRVIAGYYTTCAIIKQGKLKCWGNNTYGETGTGESATEYHRPKQVVGMTGGVSSVDTDYYFTCAVQNGKAKCFGHNDTYQLGNGTTDDSDVPRTVSTLTENVRDVDISFYTGCALLKNGAAKCWGWNGEGEVGIDSIDDEVPTPTRVHL
jgi:alpha-tubulin suppressor-like RCC1 family protein